jgi:putative membrane protein
MANLLRALVAAVALEHLGFLWLEMFQWTKPLGLKVFKLTAAQAEASASLAMNQGLYNGFLAAGLLWSLSAKPELARPLQAFFLGCVAVAGVFGAATASPRILLVQAAPALAALAVWWYA